MARENKLPMKTWNDITRIKRIEFEQLYPHDYDETLLYLAGNQDNRVQWKNNKMAKHFILIIAARIPVMKTIKTKRGMDRRP